MSDRTITSAEEFKADYPKLYAQVRALIIQELAEQYRAKQAPVKALPAKTMTTVVKPVESVQTILTAKTRSHAKRYTGANLTPDKDGLPPWRVTIDPAAAKQLFAYWAASGSKEISGLGVLSWEGDPRPSEGPFRCHIESLAFLSAGDTGGSSYIPGEKQMEYWLKLDDQGIDIGKARLWWHSHANMGTFWSTTDDQCIQACMDEQAQDQKRQGGWMLSVVVSFSKDPQILARIDWWDRDGGDFTVDKIPVLEPAEATNDPSRLAIMEVRKTRDASWDTDYDGYYGYNYSQGYRSYQFDENEWDKIPGGGYKWKGPAGSNRLPDTGKHYLADNDGTLSIVKDAIDAEEWIEQPGDLASEKNWDEHTAYDSDMVTKMTNYITNLLYSQGLYWASRWTVEGLTLIEDALTEQESDFFWEFCAGQRPVDDELANG